MTHSVRGFPNAIESQPTVVQHRPSGHLGAPHAAIAPAARSAAPLYAIGIVLLMLATGAVGWAWHRHAHRLEALRTEQQQRAGEGRVVSVARVELSPAFRDVTLPGDVRGFQQAEVYAKIGGYLTDVLVDRGDDVKRGDVLGRVESPDQDQLVAAARTELERRRRMATRMRTLAEPGIVSQQDREVAESEERIATANLGRMRALKDYSVIRAPFDGVVTARYADPGALLPPPAGSGGAPFVQISQVDRVRVFVYVAQDIAGFVHPGDLVDLWRDEVPTEVTQATVARTSGALDVRARTMQVEIDLPNPGRKLLPGVFLRVRLHVAIPPAPFVPAEAITFRRGDPYVGVVEGERLRLARVELGDNDGRTVVVTSGVRDGDLVALQLPTDLGDGAVVKPMFARSTKPASSTGRAGEAAPPSSSAGTPPPSTSAPPPADTEGTGQRRPRGHGDAAH